MGVPKQMPRIGGSASDYTTGVERGVQAVRNRETYTMTTPLKAPYPWPGGKSDIAPAVWARFGNPTNFVEPFCGSAAMLLGRPGGAHGTETVNDLDGFITNAYRAIQFDPETTAAHCDWPVSEACLTATHLWLKAQREELTSRLFADPFYFDPVVAARWLWGIASWIGDGWCVADGPWVSVEGRLVDRRTLPKEEQGEGVPNQMPQVGAVGVSRPSGANENLPGIHRYRAAVPRKMPEVGRSPNGQIGFNRKGVQAVRYQEGVPRKMPRIGSGLDQGTTGAGIATKRFEPPTALQTYFDALSSRLRRVRFLCGGWERAVKDSITVNHGLTALYLDPPYPEDEHGMRYHGAEGVWWDAARWAVSKGEEPRLRIAISGYYSEATDAIFPASWERLRWEARGGYSNQSKDGRGRENAKRECVWFSPSCIDLATDYGPLFTEATP